MPVYVAWRMNSPYKNFSDKLLAATFSWRMACIMTDFHVAISFSRQYRVWIMILSVFDSSDRFQLLFLEKYKTRDAMHAADFVVTDEHAPFSLVLFLDGRREKSPRRTGSLQRGEKWRHTIDPAARRPRWRRHVTGWTPDCRRRRRWRRRRRRHLQLLVDVMSIRGIRRRVASYQFRVRNHIRSGS